MYTQWAWKQLPGRVRETNGLDPLGVTYSCSFLYCIFFCLFYGDIHQCSIPLCQGEDQELILRRTLLSMSQRLSVFAFEFFKNQALFFKSQLTLALFLSMPFPDVHQTCDM